MAYYVISEITLKDFSISVKFMNSKICFIRFIEKFNHTLSLWYIHYKLLWDLKLYFDVFTDT